MSKSQIDSMSQSMIEQTLNTEQSKADSNQDDQSQVQESFEKSVTEKENLLMSSFNQMKLNNLVENNNNLNLLNGQNGKSAPTSDLIIDAPTNGHEKNSIETAL